MHALLASLVAIAALDSLNPTATAIQVFPLNTPKPVARSVAFVLGVFIAYRIVGLLIVLGLGKAITVFISQVDLFIPLWILYGFQFIIGVVLLVVGCKLNLSSKIKAEKRSKQLSPTHSFGLGLAVTIWESPTALPYLAAIQQIIRANLDWLSVMTILGIYNFIFVFPLIILLNISIVLQDRSVFLLNRINRTIKEWGPRILRVALIVLGVALITDSIAYVFGYPLF